MEQPAEHFCETTQLSYLQAGAGREPIVFLHGWGAFKELWWSTLQRLGPTYCAFAPDMPGHGDSPGLGTRSMTAVAQRIGRFCAARGLDTITLVGHSMGGNIAAELALARPDLVRRLVLVDAAAHGRALPLYTRSYLLETYGFAALRFTLLFGRQIRWLGERVPHDHGGGVVRPALRRLVRGASADPADLHGMLAQLMDNPLEDRVKNLAVPTLVISGALDPLVPAMLSRRLAEAIPEAQYVEIRGAGHNPMDERPQEFVNVLQGFLEHTPARLV